MSDDYLAEQIAEALKRAGIHAIATVTSPIDYGKIGADVARRVLRERPEAFGLEQHFVAHLNPPLYALPEPKEPNG